MEYEEVENEKSVKLATSLTEKMSPDLMICYFCGQEYLFEFTMKNHLLQQHKEELQKLDNWPVNLHQCPYCSASFYYMSLVPKHIAFSHSKKALDQWFAADDNLQKFQIDKENKEEPSVKLLDCSPGLNTLFNNFDTSGIDSSIKKFKRNDSSICATPKSILKKTPYSGKIVILSPQSVALQRTINNLKRTASARRELRFDLPPLQPSPEQKASESLPHLNFDTTPKKSKNIWRIFTRDRSHSPPPTNKKIKRKIREKACKLSNRSINHMITSTPRICDPFDLSEFGCDELDNSIGSNWKTATKSNDFKPLFLSTDRYQCNICCEKFNSNCDLLIHKKEKHRWFSLSLKPSYRCGSCGKKFFRNIFLVRHCHFRHNSLGNWD